MLTPAAIHAFAQSIINSEDRFSHLIREPLVPQVDLFKVHHFDNKAKHTSLKVLEFNMRMDDIEDLPFPHDADLTDEQIDKLLEYNLHDVEATEMFYHISKPAIDLRASLTQSFGIDMTNMSDVKIGETLLITEMAKYGIECNRKKQTHRDSLCLKDVIFPYVRLEHPEFQRIHQWLMQQVITETKGVFTNLTATVGGLEYVFGTGGIHASVENLIVRTSDTHQICDVDVASFYPNIGIQNRIYPAHLGEGFCDAYQSVYETRKSFPKKTPENEAYKLALNGAYGGSNNEYSPFLDMAYMMAITINGQLSLCMLIEQLIKVPGLEIIQANTDGVTYLCPREYINHVREVCRWWESVTRLELEEVQYKMMAILNVNNYLAVAE